jgi:hypothetical protein
MSSGKSVEDMISSRRRKYPPLEELTWVGFERTTTLEPWFSALPPVPLRKLA